MLPAHERLHADDLARPELHLGLVVEDELALLYRLTELAHERQPAGAVLVLVGGVDREIRISALGHVHRDVRPPEQGVHILALVGEERDPDARRHVQALARDLERRLQRAHELHRRV